MKTSLLSVLITGVALVACSSTPQRIPALEEARAAVQQVESSPAAGQFAADEVGAAHEALREADRLAAEHKSLDEINQQAYLAKRHADIAAEQISTGQAKAQVAEAEAARQKAVLEARSEQLTQARREAEQTADQAKRDAEEARRRAEMLEEQLEQQTQAKKTDRGLVLTLGDVLFDTAQATLKPGAMSTIDRLAEFLKQAPDRTVVIEGHTDSVGSDEYNLGLSQRRADAVKSALLSRGVDGSRINAVGKGKGFPVAGNETAAGRQQNRRVEIVIPNQNAGSPS